MVRRKGREVAGRGGNRAAVPGRLGSEVEKKGRGWGEADRRGLVVSVRGEKEKERWLGGLLRVKVVGGPAGLAGPKGEKVSFLFFLFQTLFKTNFSFQIQTKFFQTFSQKFYKLFRSLTSNQKPCKAN
jgi:hypothetical protein